MRSTREPDWLKLYESDARHRLTVEMVFGALPGARTSGGKLRAPCPLHGGKNRSFVVDQQKLLWTCHSKCGASGDAIGFVHRQRGGSGAVRGNDFVEAIKELCRRAGVSPRDDRQRLRLAPEEAGLVWKTARPVTADLAVARWLTNERCLDPELISEFDLARVLPTRGDLPRWAGFERDGRWRSWPCIGYRIVVPLFDHRGRLCSLRFRAPRRGTKGLSATGVSGAGLVMADSIARSVLTSGEPPPHLEGDGFRVVLAEGEPDFWSWATEPAKWGLGDRALTFPAVLGVVSGSFDGSIAARLPVGSRITSAVDRDLGGDRIHASIANHVARVGRNHTLTRWSQGT